MRTLKIGLFLLVFTIFVTGCTTQEKQESLASPKVIKLGTSPGPYSDLFLKGIKPLLEKEGYTIEATEFQELIQADIALSEVSIDLNVDQHSAYLKNFNENSQTHLFPLTTIPTVPAGIFAGRKTSLDEVKDGDKIGIPDDPSNTARAYNLLEKAKLIKLKDGTDPVKATARDVLENPYHLDIIEMKSSQIPRSLKDLDYGVIPGSVVYNAKIDLSNKLLSETILEPYELVVTVDESNKNAQWTKDVVKVYDSKEFKEFLAKENKNEYWFTSKK